jgi:cobalamin biosynthesis protein CbiG
MDRVFAGVWTLAIPALGGHSGLLAAAVLTAAAVLFAVLLTTRAAANHASATPLLARATALRESTRKAAYLPLRDPDTAGRPRPRAPGR